MTRYPDPHINTLSTRTERPGETALLLYRARITDDVEIGRTLENHVHIALSDQDDNPENDDSYIDIYIYDPNVKKPPVIRTGKEQYDVDEKIDVYGVNYEPAASWQLEAYHPDEPLYGWQGLVSRKKTESDPALKINTTSREVVLFDSSKVIRILGKHRTQEIQLRWKMWDPAGEMSTSNIAAFELQSSGQWRLSHNAWNPSLNDGPFEIIVTLPYPQAIQLKISDISGYVIRDFGEIMQAAGTSRYPWDGVSDAGIDIGAGLYIVTLECESFSGFKKFAIIR